MNIGKLKRFEKELNMLIQLKKPVPPKQAFIMFAPVVFNRHDDASEFEFMPFLTATPVPDGINHVGDFLRYAQKPDTSLTLHVREMPFTSDYLEDITDQTDWKLYGIDTMHKADQKDWSSWK